MDTVRIPPQVLRELEVVAKLLSIIFERCLRKERCLRTGGEYYSFLKDKDKEPGKYRPDSFTSVPGKVMEQLILNVISKNKVIRSSQCGLIKGKLCLNNLVPSMR